MIYQIKNKENGNKRNVGQGWMIEGAICGGHTELEQPIRRHLLLGAGIHLMPQYMGPLLLGIWVSSCVIICLVFAIQKILEKQIHMFLLKLKSYT